MGRTKEGSKNETRVASDLTSSLKLILVPTILGNTVETLTLIRVMFCLYVLVL